MTLLVGYVAGVIAAFAVTMGLAAVFDLSPEVIFLVGVVSGALLTSVATVIADEWFG